MVIHEFTNESADAWAAGLATTVECECGYAGTPLSVIQHGIKAEASHFDYEAGWEAYYQRANRRNQPGLTYTEWVETVEAGLPTYIPI